MINWLASYPKSGNTWVRVFLSAYIQDAAPDINDLTATFSDQDVVSHRLGFGLHFSDVGEQHKPMARPMSLLRIAYTYAELDDKAVVEETTWPLILKTHAANINAGHVRLIPPDITDKVVYIVRDPRDVVLSFAKHYGMDIDTSIKMMVNGRVSLMDKDEVDKPPSYSMDWRGNVASFATAQELDVTIVKFEQLKEAPVKHFSHILKWYGIPVDKKRVKRAVKNSQLSKLQAQEAENGFKETSKHAKKFFGKGKTGGWIGKLTPAQQGKIEDSCRDMMVEFGYLEK